MDRRSLVLGISLLLIAACSRSEMPDYLDSNSLGPYPLSMTEWVDAANVIFDGTVMRTYDAGLVSQLSPDGSVATVTPQPNPLAVNPDAFPTFPLIMTVVRVDTLYMDTTESLEVGQEIEIIGMDIDGDYFAGSCPDGLPTVVANLTVVRSTGEVGHQYLFNIARQTAAGAWTHTLISGMSQLDMTGPEVRSVGCPPSEASWTENRSPSAYRDEMIAEIESR